MAIRAIIKKPVIFPKHKNTLGIFGENIKLARLRRKLSITRMGERTDLSDETIRLIEEGDESIAIGHYFNVLRVLNLHSEFLTFATNDELGRKLQDLELLANEDVISKKEKDLGSD